MNLIEGIHYYVDAKSGLLVFTEKYHLQRGYCCNNGCRHCPYRKKKENNPGEDYNGNSGANSGK